MAISSLRRTLAIAATTFACLWLAAACQTTAHTPDPDIASDSFWSSVRQHNDEADRERRAKVTGGVLSRGELVAFLERGPAHLLGQVPVMPVLDGEDLLGYEIKAFFPRSPVFHRVDIAAGDVVTAVNGNKMERPEHLFELYESLRSAPRLQIDVIRNNELRTLTWEIEDALDTSVAGR